MSDYAKAAMERVVLTRSYDGVDEGTAPSESVRGFMGGARERIEGAGRVAVTGTTRTLNWVSTRIGYTMFRALSTLNLVAAVVCGVFAQVFAYYYRGALAIEPFIAALIYAPALGSMAVIRETLRSRGTSTSGFSPERSGRVLIAYGFMLGSLIASISQPVLSRWTYGLSETSMWLAIGGSFFFFYCLLISEVLFAAAVNLKVSAYARETEDLPEETTYGAM